MRLIYFLADNKNVYKTMFDWVKSYNLDIDLDFKPYFSSRVGYFIFLFIQAYISAAVFRFIITG